MVASPPLGTGVLVANHEKEVSKLSRLGSGSGSRIPNCCSLRLHRAAILGDKYGNGPLSSGTICFPRGRSGCAVRFD